VKGIFESTFSLAVENSIYGGEIVTQNKIVKNKK